MSQSQPQESPRQANDPSCNVPPLKLASWIWARHFSTQDLNVLHALLQHAIRLPARQVLAKPLSDRLGYLSHCCTVLGRAGNKVKEPWLPDPVSLIVISSHNIALQLYSASTCKAAQEVFLSPSLPTSQVHKDELMCVSALNRCQYLKTQQPQRTKTPTKRRRSNDRRESATPSPSMKMSDTKTGVNSL